MNRIVIVLLTAILSISALPGSAQTNEELLKLFAGLRVADVSDGMDKIGHYDIGLMDQEILPLWKDIDHFTHQFVGIAFTVRYVPSQKPRPGPNVERSKYNHWRDMWYTHDSAEPFRTEIKKGHVIMVDSQGDGDTGSWGSNNTLIFKTSGAVGMVTSGGIRDIDEITKQSIPVYSNILKRGRGIRPGRNELESFNKPVVIGGVLIYPGDVVVADGDGVIVVPRAKAVDVALAAREELELDKAERKKLYENLGLDPDFTIE
jgi:4-hydroxy-4-methyl-2-oxoglutarate aldolase